MGIESVSSAVTAQRQMLVQKEIGVSVLRMSLDSETAQAQQLIQMMNQGAGIGGAINTQA